MHNKNVERLENQNKSVNEQRMRNNKAMQSNEKYIESMEYTTQETATGFTFIPLTKYTDQYQIYTELAWTNTGLMFRLKSKSFCPLPEYIWEHKRATIEHKYPDKEIQLLCNDNNKYNFQIQMNDIPMSEILSLQKKERNLLATFADMVFVSFDYFIDEVLREIPDYECCNSSKHISTKKFDYGAYTGDINVIGEEEAKRYYKEYEKELGALNGETQRLEPGKYAERHPIIATKWVSSEQYGKTRLTYLIDYMRLWYDLFGWFAKESKGLPIKYQISMRDLLNYINVILFFSEPDDVK